MIFFTFANRFVLRAIFLFILLFSINSYSSEKYSASLVVDGVPYQVMDNNDGKKWSCDWVTYSDPRRLTIILNDKQGNEFFAMLEGFEVNLLNEGEGKFNIQADDKLGMSMVSLSLQSLGVKYDLDLLEPEANCDFEFKLINFELHGKFECIGVSKVLPSVISTPKSNMNGDFTCGLSLS